MSANQYRVSTSNGDNLDGTTYESDASAVEAIADRYGWSSPARSGSFATVIGETECEAFCVYETQEECDADEEGSYAPRVIEVTS